MFLLSPAGAFGDNVVKTGLTLRRFHLQVELEDPQIFQVTEY